MPNQIVQLTFVKLVTLRETKNEDYPKARYIMSAFIGESGPLYINGKTKTGEAIINVGIKTPVFKAGSALKKNELFKEALKGNYFSNDGKIMYHVNSYSSKYLYNISSLANNYIKKLKEEDRDEEIPADYRGALEVREVEFKIFGTDMFVLPINYNMCPMEFRFKNQERLNEEFISTKINNELERKRDINDIYSYPSDCYIYNMIEQALEKNSKRYMIIEYYLKIVTTTEDKHYQILSCSKQYNYFLELLIKWFKTVERKEELEDSQI